MSTSPEEESKEIEAYESKQREAREEEEREAREEEERRNRNSEEIRLQCFSDQNVTQRRAKRRADVSAYDFGVQQGVKQEKISNNKKGLSYHLSKAVYYSSELQHNNNGYISDYAILRGKLIEVNKLLMEIFKIEG